MRVLATLFTPFARVRQRVARSDAAALKVEYELYTIPSPSYEELLKVSCFVKDSDYLEAISQGKNAAVPWRPKVASRCFEHVIQRKAHNKFTVFNKTGCDEVDNFALGKNAGGSAVNDSVIEEWSLTLASPTDAGKLEVDSAVWRTQESLPAESDETISHAQEPSLVSKLVRNAFASVLKAAALSEPPQPMPLVLPSQPPEPGTGVSPNSLPEPPAPEA
eukprot:2467963-Pleurochrysis_carterae.AAC.1